MAPPLHLVFSRSISKPVPGYKLSRISYSSESEEWSTIDLLPQFPKKISKYEHFVEFSGDGLLCFLFDGVFYSDSIYVIWNPSTDKFQLIPHPDSINLPCVCPPSRSRGCTKIIHTSAGGLGFVPDSHDYKFVRFMRNSYQDELGDEHNSSDHVAVYSSKTNSWKEVPFPFNFRDDISPKDGEVCVNGFIYWMSYYRDVIISFDLSSDKLTAFPFPDGIPFPSNLYLLQLDGSLCLVIQSEKKANTELLSFWIYAASTLSSQSPWTRKTNLDVRLDADVPLWLGRKNNGGEFLMLGGSDGSVVEYDYTTTELKKFDQMHYRRGYTLFIAPYGAKNKINSHLRPHSKCDSGDIVDRISQLPDDLIVCILSFLSLKEASSTSVLSTRWSDLWRHTPNLNIPNLNFHDTHPKKCRTKYIKWVNSILESHKASSLKEFSFSFPIDYSTRSTVIKWLEFAFSRRVEVLELNLFGRRFPFLQKFLQRSTMLKSENLRSLCLKCLKVSGRTIGMVLRNCPSLEQLIIKSSVLTTDLEVCGSALKHLDIQYCKGGKSIKGYAPNLTSLKIDSGPFCSKNTYDNYPVDKQPKLAWATQQSADKPPLLPFISSQLTTLEFTLHFPSKGYFGNRFPEVPTLKELIVTYLVEHGICPITCLLCAFPNLEEFEIKCFKHIQHPAWRRTRSPMERQSGEVVNNVERFCHCHLRVFKLTWFDVGNGDHMDLMSYILDSCVALQKIIFDIYGADSPSYAAAEEYAKQLLSKLPTHIQLIISFNNRQLV